MAENPKRTEAQAAVIRHAWNHFHATREWPLARKVEVELDALLDKEGGLRAVCDSIGHDRIICEDLISAEAKVKLRIRGVAECPKTGQEVDAFLTLLRFAGVRYSEDTNATVTVQEFVERSGVEVDLAKRAFQYAMLDGGRFWRSGGGGAFTLDRFARRLRQVKTLEELDAQIQLDHAENLPQLTGGASAAGSAVRRMLAGEGLAAAIEVDADAVTGLASRKALNSMLPTLIAEADASAAPLALVMIDLDHFKSVNDNHGHPAGDKVLAETHACIDAAVRGKGTSYRYGGEEFAILLPNHESAEARAVAERVRRAVEGCEPAGIAVTASLGIAVYPADAASEEALKELADASLYEAKQGGRNRVCAHEGASAEPARPSTTAS